MGPATTMCNLLPAAGNAGALAPSTAVYIGEGIPPVPLKLAEKICSRTILTCPSSCLNSGCPWAGHNKRMIPPGQPQTPVRCQRKVTGIATWVQCFATYVGVLAGTNPEAIQELMAYLVHIVRVSQDFGSLACVNYDSAFC